MVTTRVLPGDIIDPEADDRPPLGQEDSVSGYVADQTRQQDLDVLAGLREIDGAEGVRWKVYRVNDDDPKRNGFLDEIGASQLTTNTLRDRFGGGTYRVRGHYPNGQFAAQRTIAIALDAPVRRVGAVVNEGAGSGNGFDPQRFLLEQEVREDAKRERARKERNELLALIIPAVAPIAAAMIGRQGPDLTALVAALKGPTMPEMMQGLASLKALVPEQTTDPFDRAMKIMDMIQDKTGGPGAGETGWFDLGKELIKAVGPTLGPALEARFAASGGAPSSALLQIATDSAQSVESRSLNAPAQPEENPQMFAQLVLLPWLKAQLAMALTKAQKNSDPGLIAERILDDLPAGIAPENVAELLSRADWWTQLRRFDPGVAPYAAWFAQMREAMLAELTEVVDKEGPVSPAMKVKEVQPPAAPVRSQEKPVDMPPAAPPKLS